MVDWLRVLGLVPGPEDKSLQLPIKKGEVGIVIPIQAKGVFFALILRVR